MIIDSGATSHMVPHRSWFQTYHPLNPPQLVTLRNNAKVHATRIGTVPLISQVSGKIYEVILSNVLLIPDFWLSLISIKHLASTDLSTTFPANSDTCYVRKDRSTILIAKHKDGLYHAKVTPHNQQEAAHATVDINLLHRQMGHISVN